MPPAKKVDPQEAIQKAQNEKAQKEAQSKAKAALLDSFKSFDPNNDGVVSHDECAKIAAADLTLSQAARLSHSRQHP